MAYMPSATLQFMLVAGGCLVWCAPQFFFSVPTTDNYPYPSLRNLQFVLRERKRDVFNTQQGDFFFLLCVRVHNDNQRVVVVVVVVAAVLHVA